MAGISERVRYVWFACAFFAVAMAAFLLIPDDGPAAPLGWMLRMVGVFFAIFFAVLARHAPLGDTDPGH